MIRIIEVNSVKIPVNYGMNALAEYSEMRKISMNEVLALDMNKMNLMDLLTLLYIGVKDGARKEGIECMFKSVAQFIDYADDNNEIITKVTEVFADYGKEQKGDSKKK